MIDLRPLRDRLLELPADPVGRGHPRNWLFRLKRTLDFVGHARHAQAEFFRKINPYPSPFEHVRFETEDGVTIAAWYGPPPDDGPARTGPGALDLPEPVAAPGGIRSFFRHKPTKDEEERPSNGADAAEGSAASSDKDVPFGLVLVPGMFSTKDDSLHKRRAIWVWRHWKVPVVCVDMRAFGGSTGIATGGWKEAYDVHAAAKFLKQASGCRRVGVLAESMGGASALNALAHDEESGARLIDGGLLCFSAFVDLRDAVHYISSEPPKDDPFHVQWAAFRRLLRYKSAGGYERFDEYLDDAARVNGLSSFDEMADLANPKWKTSLIKTPVLLIHATDDPVVPIRHARRMERYAKDYPHIQVMTVGWGGHTGFEARDPHWFWEVMGTYFGTLNGLELPNPIEQSKTAKAQAT